MVTMMNETLSSLIDSTFYEQCEALIRDARTQINQLNNRLVDLLFHGQIRAVHYCFTPGVPKKQQHRYLAYWDGLSVDSVQCGCDIPLTHDDDVCFSG